MAYTVFFVGVQLLFATVFLGLTSKIAGPDVILYEASISPQTIKQVKSGNETFVVLGGDRVPKIIQAGIANENDRYWIYTMNPLTLALCSVLFLTMYVVYTFLKLPESSHHCSKLSLEDEYCGESLQDHAQWIFFFSACMMYSNFVILCFVCCPKQLQVCILFAYILSAQVEVVIAPMESGGEGNSIQTFARNFCGATLLVMWMAVWTQMRTDYDGVIFIFIIKMFSELMIVGYHTGTKRTMEHVVECRVLYALCNSLLVMTMYLAWGRWR